MKFLTWNVCGLNSPKKICSVMTYLDRLDVEVAFLQETHLTKLSESNVGMRWAGVRVASSYSSYSRGVMILVKKGIPFTVLRSETDEQGKVGHGAWQTWWCERTNGQYL